jgi:hypothetical protein
MIGLWAARLSAVFFAVWPLIGAQADGRLATCAPCHPKQVSGYQRTGMANSLFRPVKQPSGRFTHAFSDTAFRIQSTGAGMRQQIERNGFKAEYDVAYVIGSGNNAFGYLTQIAGYLFQCPISYYSKRGIWDMAPGYERDREPDFTRPVTMECLLCHSGQPLPVGGTLNRYEQKPFEAEAISCDRCHGPSESHVAKPSATNIVNPVKLPARARDSVCEQCHLGGEARIPNPGRKIADFRPGQNLEELFSVYVFDTPAGSAAGGLKVVSHVEQLALSLCARQSSGKMWCGTCHDPHDKPTEPERFYRAKCLGCHTAPLAAPHVSAAANCIGCHMPRRQTKDGGHTAFTDHRIARVPVAASATPQRKLAAWHEPSAEVAKRNLGLANIVVGERDGSAFHMDAGFRDLTAVYESRPNDAAVLTSLGLVILRKGGAHEAARLYERAVALEPGYAPHHINAATAWKEAGDTAKAISHLERAIEMDPSLELAYRKLGEIYSRTNQPAKARQVFERYLKFMPGNVTARSALDIQ